MKDDHVVGSMNTPHLAIDMDFIWRYFAKDVKTIMFGDAPGFHQSLVERIAHSFKIGLWFTFNKRDVNKWHLQVPRQLWVKRITAV
jgi:hypothetical protein